MAEAAVSFAVETLGNLLIEKAVFLQNVDGEVEWLRAELRRMQCFLKDAAKKHRDSDSIRNWISEIREVAHDAEDAIEMFILNVQNKGMVARFTCFPNHLYYLNKVGDEIESIKKRLKAIEDSRVRYGIQDVGDDHDHDQRVESSRSELEVEARRRLAYWQKDKHVVGLEKDVELLLGKAIFHKNKSLSVAAILGMGGIGKSTLANKIYNHVDVVRRFKYRIWVVVSSEFKPQDIMKQILLQLGISLDDLNLLESVDSNLSRRENMKKELHRRLTGKRYFIVLDDVWEAAHWESLSSVFPDEDKASRLLLTSRNQVITMHSGYVHRMKALDFNQSWELFLRKAFVDNTNDKCPEELKNIGKEILRKCGGLPLAISVVGGLLAKKPRLESEWKKVVKEMKHHLDKRGDVATISAILELSYQNLPPELKACFLCLGFFEEDASIEAKNLVHIWVAQGLVRQEVVGQGEVMEDIGREYLNELISRNMVQIKEIEYDQVRSCHMHDLIRDLSIRKAKEEIDFEVVREEEHSHAQYSLLDRPRHRAIYCSDIRFIYSTTNRNQYLRSIFIHRSTPKEIVVGPSRSFYWKSFELLRVIDLGHAVLPGLPRAIGGLTGLRYFKMDALFASKLPRSWGKLKNLEVLDLRGYGRVIIIDKVIVKMDNLRHLYADTLYSVVGLGGMKNLQTLSVIQVKDSDLWQIHGMNGVSNLGLDMSGTTNPSTFFAYLAELHNLECLTLRHYWGAVNMEGLGALHRVTQLTLINLYSIKSLPGDFPPGLSYLTLSNLPLIQDPMPVLERLPKLSYLKMYNAYKSEEMVVSSHGFPGLRVLHLERMQRIRSIEIEEHAMVELMQFIVRDCENLNTRKLPDHIISAVANAH